MPVNCRNISWAGKGVRASPGKQYPRKTIGFTWFSIVGVATIELETPAMESAPLGFVLTPGEADDVQGFGPLFRMIADKAEHRWPIAAMMPTPSARRSPSMVPKR